jgi:flagellar assembly factor FliW
VSIRLESSRFGRLEIPDDAVIDVPNGLIGRGGRRFALLARGEEGAFVWLQSTEDPGLALALTNPRRFFPSYEVELADADAARIGAEDGETSVYVAVCMAGSMEDLTANLRTPLVIAGQTGHHVVNQAAFAPRRAPLLHGLAAAA